MGEPFTRVETPHKENTKIGLEAGGESEELNDFQTAESHNFPQPFMESKDQLRLAPAALVRARNQSHDPPPSTMESLEINKPTRPSPIRSIVYKEQGRLNQAATSALMARLEAQKAIRGSAEKELQKRLNQRDDLEKQMQPKWEARKRSRTDNDDDAQCEEKNDKTDKTLISLPKTTKTKMRLHKEQRVLLEEEQKLLEAFLSLIEERKGEERQEEEEELKQQSNEPLRLTLGQDTSEDQVEDVNEDEGTSQSHRIQRSKLQEDEESRKEKGKGNVEKWLQILLENTGENDLSPPKTVQESDLSKTDEIIKMPNEKYPQKEIAVLRVPISGQSNRAAYHEKKNEDTVETEARKPETSKGNVPIKILEEKNPKKQKLDPRRKNEVVKTEGSKPRSVSTSMRSITSRAGVIGKGEEIRKSLGGGSPCWADISLFERHGAGRSRPDAAPVQLSFDLALLREEYLDDCSYRQLLILKSVSIPVELDPQIQELVPVLVGPVSGFLDPVPEPVGTGSTTGYPHVGPGNRVWGSVLAPSVHDPEPEPVATGS
ncbi:hypothetical protein Cgig2_016596 [Carnegiea gigantea]|uniref:Uncharacterized protein n=1 Tax=Carnegiea gigantea TaxID=171969 RepID=A0A9Q1KY26_9CARY|nr:hypothetical protein Cgig2_016596 [Carnegiea gigantea]